MKITMYELLGMLKDGKAPKTIIFEDEVYEYSEKYKDYYDDKNGDYLFDIYGVVDILSNEVVILETTITYKQDEPIFKKIDGEWYVRKDYKPNDNIIFVEKEKKDDKIEKLKDILRVDDLEPPYDFNLQKIWCQTIKNQNKINEIIDYLNGE